MKLKASEFLAIQIDSLSDVSKLLKQRKDDLSVELGKEIDIIEQNLNQLCMVMVSKEQERLRGSEL